MRRWLLMFALSATAAAAPPATRPTIQPPPMPRPIGQAIDPQRPAFVPRFARIDNPPAGHFAERDWAYRFGSPGFYGYGFGFGYGFGWGFGGYGLGGGWVPNAVAPG